MRYWKRVDNKGNITTVESYSHSLDIEGAIEISKKEFDAFIAALPPPPDPPPQIDLGKEIDKIRDNLRKARTPGF